MDILMISYGEYEFDGRLRELFNISKKIGTTYLISRGLRKTEQNHYIVNGSYSKFIREAYKIGKSLNSIQVYFWDNRKSIIPGLLLKRHHKESKVILDCRELYLMKYVHHFSGKIGCLIEKLGIKKAHTIICANQERANFMKEYYKLDSEPLVFENLRALEYSSKENEEASKNRFKHYEIDDEIRIVSTSGCDVTRMNDVLVENLSKVNKNCRLLLVGNSRDEDILTIKNICHKNRINNVDIIGRLNQDDLKALLSYCHIGVVNYNQKDLNNKYCASGKIFEFLYEGIPVVTTTNPPLKNFCEKEKIGCCSDLFYDAINDVVNNYCDYYNAVKEYCELNTIEDNNNRIVLQLKKILF